MTRAFRYFFDEAIASLQRGYRAALIATATVIVAFLVLGGFLMLVANIERVFARWQDAAELSVYLTETATDLQRAEVEKTARASDLAIAVEPVSKDEALRRFRQNFSELAEVAGQLPANPLPASIEVRLRPDADAGSVEALARSTAQLPGVADVRYDRRWIERLLRAVGILRAGGITLAALLVCAAALTVASVVRLALLARHEEIHIMQLVGAPIAYIKGPLVVEGFIQGGVGAAVAIVILWGAFRLAGRRLDGWLVGAIEPASLVFLSLPTIVLLLVAGMAVGAIGGFIAAQGTREVLD